MTDIKDLIRAKCRSPQLEKFKRRHEGHAIRWVTLRRREMLKNAAYDVLEKVLWFTTFFLAIILSMTQV